MRRQILLLFISIIFVVSAIPTTNIDALQVSENMVGIITYICGDDYQICELDLETMEIVQLTSGSGGYFSPMRSPDGDKIIFMDGAFGGTKIWVMDSDGSNQKQLTRGNVADQGAKWSPDGKKIVFSRKSDGSAYFEIWTMDADGSNSSQLTDNDLQDHAPVWNADGTQILFSQYHNRWQIWSMDSDGSNQQRLLGGFRSYYCPALSPNGDQLLVQFGAEVWIVNPDGTNSRELTNVGDRCPFAWSADSKFFVVTRNDESIPTISGIPSATELWIIDNQGNDILRLTDNDTVDMHPNWWVSLDWVPTSN